MDVSVCLFGPGLPPINPEIQILNLMITVIFNDTIGIKTLGINLDIGAHSRSDVIIKKL